MKQRSKYPRRCGIERRQFCYTSVFPERRNGKDRRILYDRRDVLTVDFESEYVNINEYRRKY